MFAGRHDGAPFFFFISTIARVSRLIGGGA